jgi:DNA polymerase III delta prime subunit
MQKEIMNLKIDNKKKMVLIGECGEAEFRISEGSDSFVQLEAFLAKIGLIGNE